MMDIKYCDITKSIDKQSISSFISLENIIIKLFNLKRGSFGIYYHDGQDNIRIDNDCAVKDINNNPEYYLVVKRIAKIFSTDGIITNRAYCNYNDLINIVNRFDDETNYIKTCHFICDVNDKEIVIDDDQKLYNVLSEDDGSLVLRRKFIFVDNNFHHSPKHDKNIIKTSEINETKNDKEELFYDDKTKQYKKVYYLEYCGKKYKVFKDISCIQCGTPKGIASVFCFRCATRFPS